MSTEIKYNGETIATTEAGQTATLACSGYMMRGNVVVTSASDGVPQEDLEAAINAALRSAKESGEFDGEDGISPTVSVSKVGKVTTITITDANGTHFATIKDGADGTGSGDGTGGADGENGVGIASVVQTTTSAEDGGINIITVTLTDGSAHTFQVRNGSTGEKGADGYTPVKGTDYYTDADKTEMVNLVLAALPTWTGGSY